MKRLIPEWIITVIVLSCMDALLPSMQFADNRTMVLTALFIAMIDEIYKPLLDAYQIKASVLSMSVFSFVVNTVVILLVFFLISKNSTITFTAALLVSLDVTVIQRLLDIPYKTLKKSK